MLTALVLLVFVRDRRLLLGIALAALASVVAAAPFLVHLSEYPQEVVARYLQTAALDPNNQQRLAYLTPPEPLGRLLALQVERTLGMFDRYADGGSFLPSGQPLFGTPLAQLALVGAFYVVVRGWRDARVAVVAIWLWIGLLGVAATVETPELPARGGDAAVAVLRAGAAGGRPGGSLRGVRSERAARRCCR